MFPCSLAPTIGTAPLAVFYVQNAVVSHCLPKTSKTYGHVMQVKLEDGMVILLAANTLENYNRWYEHFRSASCKFWKLLSPVYC